MTPKTMPALIHTGHRLHFLNLPVNNVFIYNPTEDGPECEVITRILAKHSLYIPGMERRAIAVSRCLELISLLRYKKSFALLNTDQNAAVHRAVTLMMAAK